MPKPRSFDADKAAYYEKAGWEAYYDRNWPRAFWLMVQLNHHMFSMPWWAATAAALDIVRASIAFAPVDNDIPKAQNYLANFYTKARRYAGIQTDADALAALEMEYWVVHRHLAIERQQNPEVENLEPLVDSLANLHAALFHSTPDAIHTSAHYRALAAEAVDRITGKRSLDIQADWRAVEENLRTAYRAVAS
jgi:hypothetical protein